MDMEKKVTLKEFIPDLGNALNFISTGKSAGVEMVKAKLRDETAKKREAVARAETSERRTDLIEEVASDTRFLVEDRKAQKQRRGIAARQTQRDTKDSDTWDRYEAFRTMKRHLALARKEHRRLTQLQVATRVIEASNKAITIKADSLVRIYRAWLEKRNRTD
jgi:hypothetical protein